MKTQKLIFAMLMLPLLFMSCSKEGDGPQEQQTTEEKQLVGTWVATKVDRTVLDSDGEIIHEETITDIDVTFVFKANGTVIDNEGFEGTFRIANDQIIISYEDDDDYVYDIVSLTDTDAVVSFTFDNVSGKTEDKYTLKKQ